MKGKPGNALRERRCPDIFRLLGLNNNTTVKRVTENHDVGNLDLSV